MSGGPVLEFSVEGARVGDTLRLPPQGGTVEVTARARSVLPVHTLQVVQAGEVVAEARAPDAAGARDLALNARVTVTRDGWLCARAGGPNYADPVAHHDVWERGIFA